MVSLILVDSVNVLTLLTSPGTLGLIHTLKEVQQHCWREREGESREQDVLGYIWPTLSVVYPESCYS